jgi:hypothetical protein
MQSRMAMSSVCHTSIEARNESLEALIQKGYRAGSTVVAAAFSVLVVRFVVDRHNSALIVKKHVNLIF